MKLQGIVRDVLKEGGILVHHISHNRKACYRLLDKDRNPVRNVTNKTVKSMRNKHIIDKIDGVFVFIKPQDRPASAIIEFYVSDDNWQTFTKVSAQSPGKAKYEFMNNKPESSYLKLKVKHANSSTSGSSRKQRTITPRQ